MVPFVSVVIPCYNEEKFIGPLLENILAQDYPAERMEVLVVDGYSTDNTREIIQEILSRDKRIRLLNNEKQYVSFALNKAILESEGEIIIRMDAHAVYPDKYISKLVDWLEKLKADNVGGSVVTIPSQNTAKGWAIATAISSPFGIGDSRFRLKTKKVQKVDTVPFGCYRKEVFDRIGLFNESLLRNQDDEFNGRLVEYGGKIYLIPDIEIHYYSRNKIWSIIRMFYQYGLFKPLVNLKLKKPASLRQFAPPVFLLYLTSLAIVLTFAPVLALYYSGFLLVYLVLDLAFTLRAIFLSNRLSLIIYLPWLYFLIHITYGFGYLKGIVKFRLSSETNNKIPSSR